MLERRGSDFGFRGAGLSFVELRGGNVGFSGSGVRLRV